MSSREEQADAQRAYKYYVYVIDLKPSVLNVHKFSAANPDYQPGKPCVYVGSSCHKPGIRYNQHKAGYKANKYAEQYGWRLLTEEYRRYNPMRTREEAIERERWLAEHLRQKGYAVWQG